MSRQHLYTGKSGQLAVMAEFVSRGYNVAVPEVDVGDDIFIIRDQDGELSRVQVKTANARELPGGGFSAVFKLSERRLRTPQRPEMNYLLAVRYRESWRDFVVITRAELSEIHGMHGIGRDVGGSVLFVLVFSEGDVLCVKQSLQAYRNNWSKWPAIDHGAKLAPDFPDAPEDAGQG